MPPPANATEAHQQAELRAQLQQLEDLRQQMKAILDEVPAQKQKANGLQARMERIRARVGQAELEAVLQKQTPQPVDAPLPGLSPWRQRARDIDQQIAALPRPPEPSTVDSAELKRLKTEFQKELHALSALQAATQLAFRALSAIDGLERSVETLERAFPQP